MYSNAASSNDVAAAIVEESPLPESSGRRPWSGGADSFRSGSTTGLEDDSAPKSPPRVETGGSGAGKMGHRRRRSLLERLGISRHHE